jgi:hypothetical protein
MDSKEKQDFNTYCKYLTIKYIISIIKSGVGAVQELKEYLQSVGDEAINNKNRSIKDYLYYNHIRNVGVLYNMVSDKRILEFVLESDDAFYLNFKLSDLENNYFDMVRNFEDVDIPDGYRNITRAILKGSAYTKLMATVITKGIMDILFYEYSEEHKWEVGNKDLVNIYVKNRLDGNAFNYKLIFDRVLPILLAMCIVIEIVKLDADLQRVFNSDFGGNDNNSGGGTDTDNNENNISNTNNDTSNNPDKDVEFKSLLVNLNKNKYIN